jgi:hypothetical protein
LNIHNFNLFYCYKCITHYTNTFTNRKANSFCCLSFEVGPEGQIYLRLFKVMDYLQQFFYTRWCVIPILCMIYFNIILFSAVFSLTVSSSAIFKSKYLSLVSTVHVVCHAFLLTCCQIYIIQYWGRVFLRVNNLGVGVQFPAGARCFCFPHRSANPVRRLFQEVKRPRWEIDYHCYLAPRLKMNAATSDFALRLQDVICNSLETVFAFTDSVA